MTDIIRQKTNIGKTERSMVKNHKPYVIWLTGLNCSGKSTIANALEGRLNKLNYHTYLLDGDNIRYGLNKDLGFSAEDRAENMRRVGEVARLFIDAGIITLCAFISPFKNDRKKIRNLFGEEEFIEIYVDTSLEVCMQRDVKGHYKKAVMGEIKEFTGINSPYEPPENAEIKIRTEECSVDDAVKKILMYLKIREK